MFAYVYHSTFFRFLFFDTNYQAVLLLADLVPRFGE